MRIRIGPGGRMLSLVVVGILAATLVQGDVVSAQFTGKANSQCLAPTPGPFLATGVVQIDVKPGAPRNPVNVQSGGLVEIAICSEDADGPGGAPPTFNAPEKVIVICNNPTLPPFPLPSSPSCRNRNVPDPLPGPPVGFGLAPGTPTAGSNGFEFSLHSCHSERDVNGDGAKDLVCHFFVNRMGLTPASTIITLRGCCDTPEFEGANFINCEADCQPSIPPDECGEFC